MSFTVTVPSLPTSIVAPSGKFGFAFLTASSTAFFSGSVRLDGSATLTGSAGATTAASSAFLTVLSGVNFPSSLPSLSFTVTVPSLPTSIVAPSGNVGFAFLTASSTAFFSSGVKLDGSFTSTGSAGATIASAFLTVCAGVNLPISLPSLSVTVTDPSSPTVTFASAGRSLFASLTAFSTSFFSSSVNLDGSFTLTGVGALSFSNTVSSWDSAPVLPPSVTITVPSLLTSIFAVSGKSLLAFLTASLTFPFSSSVKCDLSATSVFSGAFKAILLSLVSSFLTVLSAVIFLSPAVPIGTVTVPSSATWISSSLKPRSGLAALTASLTFCFS